MAGTTLLAITEDWFALSHFQPLIEVMLETSDRVVVLTRVGAGEERLKALGVEVYPLDFSRASLNPVKQFGVVRRMARILAEVRPERVHLMALQTMVVGSLALRLAGIQAGTCLHLTGAGFLVTAARYPQRGLRWPMLAVLRSALNSPRTLLLVENPDDARLVTGGRTELLARVALIPGAGVDPTAFPQMPPTGNQVPVVSYVGRMLRSKGLHVLREAGIQLSKAGVPADVRMYGPVDATPDCIPEQELAEWCGRGGEPRWMGPTRDVAGVWKQSDICVMAPLGGDGMPRAMLEAASCGRALIVSDVPGCRHFVTHEKNGLVVIPGNVEALYSAIRRLVENSADAARLGLSARDKLVSEYSVSAVQTALRQAYLRLEQ